jgi:hypothetical protein
LSLLVVSMFYDEGEEVKVVMAHTQICADRVQSLYGVTCRGSFIINIKDWARETRRNWALVGGIRWMM